eukprot:GHVH01005091.1.p1 GENE.GHVH01005091.1~~GHVH01005091.1.p1  ORF type:complete len:859 (+),score=141.12 GHVH01005091.1:50-2626(+)
MTAMRRLKRPACIPDGDSVHPEIHSIVFGQAKRKDNIVSIKQCILATLTNSTSATRKDTDMRTMMITILYLHLCNLWTVEVDQPRLVASLCRDLFNSKLFGDRRVGGLAIGLLFKELHAGGFMSLQDIMSPIKHILIEGSPALQSIALSVMLEGCDDKAVVEELFDEVSDVANPVTNAPIFVRSKALACMSKMIPVWRSPDSYLTWARRLAKTIQIEKQPTILLAVVRVIKTFELYHSTQSGDDLTRERGLLMECLVKLLSISINESVPSNYHFSGVPTPWLVIEILDCIAVFPYRTIATAQDILSKLILQILSGLGSYLTDGNAHGLTHDPKEAMRVSLAISTVDILTKTIDIDGFQEARLRMVSTFLTIASKQKRYAPIIIHSSIKALTKVMDAGAGDELDEMHLNLESTLNDPVVLYDFFELAHRRMSKGEFACLHEIMLKGVMSMAEIVDHHKPAAGHSLADIRFIGPLPLTDNLQILKRMVDTMPEVFLKWGGKIVSLLDVFFELFNGPLAQSLDSKSLLFVGQRFMSSMCRITIGYSLAFESGSIHTIPKTHADEHSSTSTIILQLYALQKSIAWLKSGGSSEVLLQFSCFVIGEFSHLPQVIFCPDSICSEAIDNPLTASLSCFRIHHVVSHVSRILGNQCTLPQSHPEAIEKSSIRLLITALVKVAIRFRDETMIRAIATVCLQKAAQIDSEIVSELNVLLTEGLEEDLCYHSLFPRELVKESIQDGEIAEESSTLINLYKIRNQSHNISNASINGSPSKGGETVIQHRSMEVHTKSEEWTSGISAASWPPKVNTTLRTGLLKKGFLIGVSQLALSIISIYQMDKCSISISISIRVPEKESPEDEDDVGE